jgi:hypothetical protein
MKLRGRISSVLLVAVGGPVVHELRCYLGFGSGGGHEATAQGHLYLGSPALALTLLGGLALGQLVVQIAAARVRPAAGRTPAGVAVWVAAFVALLMLVALQELAEGLFASAHGGSPWATFGHGGWLAVPLCAGLALAVAFWLRISASLVAKLAGSVARPSRHGGMSTPTPRPSSRRRVSCPLALQRAERAPPIAVLSLTA